MQCTIINTGVQAYERCIRTSYPASLLLLSVSANSVLFLLYRQTSSERMLAYSLPGTSKRPVFSALCERSEYSQSRKEVKQPNFFTPSRVVSVGASSNV